MFSLKLTHKPMNIIRVFHVKADGLLGPDDVIAQAIDEEGRVIAGHYCSHPSFVAGDMGVTSSWNHDKYAKRYPDGYEVKLLHTPPEEIGRNLYERIS
jgi:hypothetical protein